MKNAKPTGLPKNKIEEFAVRTAKSLGYTPGGLNDVIEELGGRVEIKPELEFGQSGYIRVNREDDFTIYLSQYTNDNHDNFTIAHELGHYILHAYFQDNYPIEADRHLEHSDRLEWEANWFAAAFLMPENEFKLLIDQGYDSLELANHFQTSIKAVEVRKKVLELI